MGIDIMLKQKTLCSYESIVIEVKQQRISEARQSTVKTEELDRLMRTGRFNPNPGYSDNHILDSLALLKIKDHYKTLFRSISDLKERVLDQINTPDMTFSYLLHVKKDSKYVEIRCNRCDKFSQWYATDNETKVIEDENYEQTLVFARSNNKNHCCLQHASDFLIKD